MKFSNRDYYYLVAGLPDLLLDEGRTKASGSEFRKEAREQLHPDDDKLMSQFFLKYDNENLLNLLNKNNKPFIDQGSYSQDFLEEQIKEPDGRIHDYMRRFIEEFKNQDRDNQDLPWENILEGYYYDFLLAGQNKFVNAWFELELNMNNITTALNCRKHELPVENQLIGNHAVVQSILRSNARDFGLAQDFPEIEKILAAWEQGYLLDREKELDAFRWNWLDENTFFYYFSVEKVIAYLLQLRMAERWMKLDPETGESMFRKLLDDLGRSFKLPEEFQMQNIKRK